MRALRMSHCFTLVSPFPSHLPLVVVVAGLWLRLVFPGFASARGIFLVYTSRVLDDRQCFTARSARRKKKSSTPPPAVFAPPAQGKGRKQLSPPLPYAVFNYLMAPARRVIVACPVRLPTPPTLLSPRPGLSLWQVPPLLPNTVLSLYSPYILLFSPSPQARLVIVAGPAVFLISCYPPPQPSLSACHCGRSRPILLISCYPPPQPSPFLPTHHGPACHCGRSRLVFLLSLLIPTSFPFPFHLPRPSLSLWQVPPRLTPPPYPSPFLPTHQGPACHCGRSRRLSPWWKNFDTSKPFLQVKTVDLKSAYKQFAIHPSDRRLSVLALKRPETGEVAGFVSGTLPFGSTASVLHFNRAARLLHRIGLELDVAWTNYYDDYPVVEFSFLAANTSHTIRALTSLLGFECSTDKGRPFADEAEMLGVVLDVSKSGCGILSVKNKQCRMEELATNLQSLIDAGRVDPKKLPSLFWSCSLC